MRRLNRWLDTVETRTVFNSKTSQPHRRLKPVFVIVRLVRIQFMTRGDTSKVRRPLVWAATYEAQRLRVPIGAPSLKLERLTIGRYPVTTGRFALPISAMLQLLHPAPSAHSLPTTSTAAPLRHCGTRCRIYCLLSTTPPTHAFLTYGLRCLSNCFRARKSFRADLEVSHHATEDNPAGVESSLGLDDESEKQHGCR